jgi:hypothetical protein
MGQQMILRPQDRKARQQHVAELTAAAMQFACLVREGAININRGSEHEMMVRQQLRQIGHLVSLAGARRKPFHLLQRDDIRVRNLARNPGGVEHEVATFAVLDIVGHELHVSVPVQQ